MNLAKALCHLSKDSGIWTDEREMIETWKQHYYEHLNGAETVD